MSQLVYRQACEHGSYWQHNRAVSNTTVDWCPGGVEQVLDPDKVLWNDFFLSSNFGITVTAADVLTVLDQEE